MITSFTTSRENANSTDLSPTLREPGKYVCLIKEADTFERNNTNGNYQFVRLLIEAADKRTGTIELCVAGGQSNWQARLFDAVCVCAGVENPQFEPAKIKNHRRGIIDQTVVQGYRCRALEGKKLGVLLQRVWRDYTDKKDGKYHETFDLVLYKPFNADSELTASEIIGGSTTPKNLPSALESCMKDRDLRKGEGALTKSDYQPSAADTAADLDNEPF